MDTGDHTGRHTATRTARAAGQKTIFDKGRLAGHGRGYGRDINPQPSPGRKNTREATDEDATSEGQLGRGLTPEDAAQEQEDTDEGAEKETERPEESTMSWSIPCQCGKPAHSTTSCAIEKLTC